MFEELQQKWESRVLKGDIMRLFYNVGVPVLNYEIINANVTSTLFYGGCVGYFIRLIVSPDHHNDMTAIYIALPVGFFLAVLIVLTDSYHGCCTDRFIFLSRFYPRAYTVKEHLLVYNVAIPVT